MKPPVSNPDLNPRFFRFDEIRVQINWVREKVALSPATAKSSPELQRREEEDFQLKLKR